MNTNLNFASIVFCVKMRRVMIIKNMDTCIPKNSDITGMLISLLSM